MDLRVEKNTIQAGAATMLMRVGGRKGGKERRGKERSGEERRGEERRGKERKGEEWKGEKRRGKDDILIFSNFLIISKLNFSSFIFAFFISCFFIYFLPFHTSVLTCFTFVGFSGVLRAGDGIYIPKGFFHYCATTSRSCSVNFWWL